MTATELIAILTASAGAIATGLGTILNSRRAGADNEIKSMRAQIAKLDHWKIVARSYIAQLRGELADRGIKSPEPPPELELYGGDRG